MITANAGSRHIRVPNAAVVSRRRASSSRVNGTTGSRMASPSPSTRISGVRWARTPGPATRVATSAGDGHRDRQPGDAGDLVADPLGEQDVRRPARGGAEGEGDAQRVGLARPWLRQQDHADRGQQCPGPADPAAAPCRDAERSEELQRAGRAQRQPLDRRHEQHVTPAVTTPRAMPARSAGPGELREPRPDDDQQQHAGPREPQPRRTLRADDVDQPDRRREPELDAEHRGDGHPGAGPGRGAGARGRRGWAGARSCGH